MLQLLHEAIPTTHQDQYDDGECECDTVVLIGVLYHGDIRIIVKGITRNAL